jgi:3',5'-cyclic AMP phosphodiesterase CpdA
MLGLDGPRSGRPAAARVVVVSDSHLSPTTPEAAVHRFSVAAGRWRVVGVDSQLFNAADEDEADQWAWLESEAAAIGGDTPVVVVSHKPLVPGPGDDDRRARYIQAPARERLAALLDRVDARLFVSGHVHQSLRHVVTGRLHVWVPTTWAALPDAVQPPVGEKRPGIVELTLCDDGAATVTVRRLPGVEARVIGVDVA